MANGTEGPKGMTFTVNRVTRIPASPPTFAGFVFATQVGNEVQLDLCAMDFADVNAKMMAAQRDTTSENAVPLDVVVYESVVIPEDAARILHDTLSKAVANWDRIARLGREEK